MVSVASTIYSMARNIDLPACEQVQESIAVPRQIQAGHVKALEGEKLMALIAAMSRKVVQLHTSAVARNEATPRVSVPAEAAGEVTNVAILDGVATCCLQYDA